ncbi:MAG: zinc-dependent alcohol dehydrogenase [Chloroflexota bacterium]
MRALAKVDDVAGHVELVDAPQPSAQAGEILIQVAACGICGTDLTLYQWPAHLATQMGVRFPIVFGHEFGGHVVEMGKGVEGFQIGDLVTVNPHLYCKKCHYCLSERHEICLDRPIIGYNTAGGFAEFVAVRAENVYKLAPAVPPVVAALGEPLALGAHLAARAGIGPGAFTVVIGPGPIGLVTTIGCRNAGAERVLVVGLPSDEERLAIARNWGAETFHAGDPALVEAVMQATDGLGAEAVFEVTGSEAGLRLAFSLGRKDGTVYAVGIPHKESLVDVAAMVYAERRLVGSRGYRPQDWAVAADLINRRWQDLAPLVSDVLPLGHYHEAFAKSIARQGVRVVMDPRR